MGRKRGHREVIMQATGGTDWTLEVSTEVASLIDRPGWVVWSLIPGPLGHKRTYVARTRFRWHARIVAWAFRRTYRATALELRPRDPLRRR